MKQQIDQQTYRLLLIKGTSMKVRTSELSGVVLDWAVAKAYGASKTWLKEFAQGSNRQYSPSINWQAAGPIIEREGICVGRKHQCDPAYCELNDPAVNHWARTPSGGFLSYGPTSLVAAMRCYVYSKLGEVVDVPDELNT